MRHIVFPLLKFVSRNFSRSAAMMRKIAVCQMTSVQDKMTNLQVVEELIQRAAKEKAEMIFFPEACDFIAEKKENFGKLSEPFQTGMLLCRYRELAAHHKVWLSMGGLHEKSDDDPSKVYITHVIINSSGNVAQAYRKLHLFDLEIPEKNLRLKESDFSNPGCHVVCPVETPVGRTALSICYDMRFPELATLNTTLDAELLTYPSAFTYPTGEAHWHALLRARAIENQCYVVAAAQQGQHNPRRRSYGHALVVDPWGVVLADCQQDSPSYQVVDIDLTKLRNIRENMPVFKHRRKDMYALQPLALRKELLGEHNCLKAESKAEDEPEKSEPKREGNYYKFGQSKVPDSCCFYKSEHSFAFVNLRCVIPGHVLVAPLREVERNEGLTDAEGADFFKAIRVVQKLMETVHNTDSCTVTIQDGEAAGRTINQLHCHIMPRRKGDFLDSDLIYMELRKHDQCQDRTPSKPARSLQEMEEEAKSLRAVLEKLQL